MNRHIFSIKPSNLLLALALTIAAAVPGTGWAWSATTKITSIGSYADGHAVVTFADFTGNNLCGTNQFSLGTASDPKQKAMLAIATSAFLSGRQVSVSTAAGTCQGGQEVINWIAIVE